MKPESKTTQHKQLDEFQLPGADMHTTNPETSQGLLPNGEVDHEGAMAKADLFKLSNYSYKLFKKLEDDQQLEAWVQAKITKAADYIASVYHYLEYEMKISEYGAKLENSDMYTESQKAVIQSKLSEAREMVRHLKIAQAQKLSESKSPKAKKDWDKDGKIESEKDEVIGSRRKAAGLDKKEIDESRHSYDSDWDYADSYSKRPRAKHYDYDDPGFDPADEEEDAKAAYKKNTSKKSKETKLDELDKSTLKSYTKAASQDLVDKSSKLAKTDSSKKQAELGRKVVNRTRGIATAVDKMEESKPSAGLSKKKKSEVVKAAKSEKDIGKPGKGFEKVAKKAAKKYGSKEKGEKVAAAAMWKNIKESVEMAFGEGVYAEEQQIDELNLKPWKKKSPFSKRGYEEVAHRQSNKMKDAELATDAADEKGDNAGIKKAGQDWKKAKSTKERALDKAAKAKKESINESAELNAIKLLSGLN